MLMAGYSKTPLIKKLGIKPDSKILFINEPASIYKELGQLPQVEEVSKKEHFDYVHFFTKEKNDLDKFFKEVKKVLDKEGMLWISWPKTRRGGGGEQSRTTKKILRSDLDENIIREIGLKEGLVDVKVAAIDDTWSALKFVLRLKDR